MMTVVETVIEELMFLLSDSRKGRLTRHEQKLPSLSKRSLRPQVLIEVSLTRLMPRAFSVSWGLLGRNQTHGPFKRIT